MQSILDLPHQSARALAATGAPIYLSVNPCEYHGPHLSLRNDALISDGLTADLHRRLSRLHPEWPLLLGGRLDLGVDPVPGPGSQPTPFPVLRRAVLQACQALAELGARRVVLMTFHGGPLHNIALFEGVKRLSALGIPTFAPMGLMLREIVSFDVDRFAPALALIEDANAREGLRRSLRFDFHAGFIETSLALHYAPQAVSSCHLQLLPCPPIVPSPWMLWAASVARSLGSRRMAADLAFMAEGLGWYGLRPFPGYTGQPHLASPEAGAIIARILCDSLAASAEEILAGRAETPPPILPYLRALTLGGRIQALGVPQEAMLYR
jgi:creatinine amidohydrolase